MKALLRFDLNDEFDRVEHLQCTKASDMAGVIFQFALNSRRQIEAIMAQRSERGIHMTSEETLELIFQHFNDLLDNANINPEDITI